MIVRNAVYRGEDELSPLHFALSEWRPIVSTLVEGNEYMTMNTFDHQAQHLSDRVRKMFESEKKAPLKVSIMGQTGVGKTSLINALFNADLKVDPVRSTTKEIDEPFIFRASGNELWFYDLPGIGESSKTENSYLEKYRKMLRQSDIVLWAIHADCRSFVYDHDALQKIFETIDHRLQAQLMSRITFLLTKVDLLMPAPWYLIKIGEQAIFLPHPATENLLEQKEFYLQETFILPYGDSLVSQTYHSGDFAIDDPHIRYDKNMVYYDGLLNKEGLEALKQRFHGNDAVFDRLYDNYRVIPCSSRYRFNLDLLMRVIINKLGSDAASRFSNFYKSTTLERMPLTRAKELRDLIVFDHDQQRILFDLANMEI